MAGPDFFLQPDGPSEQNLTFSMHAWCNLNILQEILEILSIPSHLCIIGCPMHKNRGLMRKAPPPAVGIWQLSQYL